MDENRTEAFRIVGFEAFDDEFNGYIVLRNRVSLCITGDPR